MLIDNIKNIINKGKVVFSLILIIMFSLMLNKSTNLQDFVFQLNKLFAPLESFQYTLKNYSQLAMNIEKLEKEIIDLKIENRRLQSKQHFTHNEFLKNNTKFKYTSGNVTFFYPGLTSTSYVVDRGMWRGVKKDMGVIDTKGVIGKVVKVSQNNSLVININDPSFRVGIKTSSGEGTGIVQYSGRSTWNVNYVNDGEKFKVNDTLYTSGFGGIFPENLPFGVVSVVEDVNFSYYPEIEVVPFANYKNPNHVFILENMVKEELK